MKKIKPYTVIKWRWFTGINTVGVVLIQNSVKEQTVRIGWVENRILHLNDGTKIQRPRTEEDDARFIAQTGSRLSFEEAHGFFPELLIENYKNY